MLLVVAVLALLAACASTGRPSGGDYDVDPPIYMQSNPAIGAKNVKTNKYTIHFNENVQVEDVTNKVVVSPAQKNIPSISANGKQVTVELRDTIIPNTTYTIDFSDAIKDLNEGNVLDGFAMDFSTGDVIDSLRISGMVFDASNLEPAQGMLVGVYKNLSDTAISTLPLERIAKTNQLGQFTIRGLSPGTYRIYALNDLNRDYHWDRSEDVAFYDVTVSPHAEFSSHIDTIFTATGAIDTIMRHDVANYFPNDILLTWFNEGYQSQYLKDYSRPDRRRLLINLAAKSDTFPEIRLLNGVDSGKNISEWSRLNTVATRDTLEYFITDKNIIAQDTMMIEMKYLRTDTTDQLSWGTDTLKVIFKGAREEARQKAETEKKAEQRRKKAEKSGENIDSIEAAEAAKLTFINITPGNRTQEVYLPLTLTFDQPIDTIIEEGVHFAIQRDSIWDTIPAPPIQRVNDFNLMRYKIDYKWEPGAKYNLTIDSASVIGAYNEWNAPFKQEISVRTLEEYSALYFNLTGIRDSAMVEVLDKSDKPVAVAPVINGTASFPYLQPGTYYARMYLDRNGNGKWDTGKLLDSIQPEEVYYYPKKLVLKKNWDVEQAWDIYDTAIDLQKPKEITKNKPKETKKKRNKDGSYIEDDRKNSDDEDEEDEYGNSNFFGPSGSNGMRNNVNGFNNLRNSF
jgi:hypothetical protein